MYHPFLNNETQEQTQSFMSMLLQGADPSSSTYDATTPQQVYPYHPNFTMVNGGYEATGSTNFENGNAEGLLPVQKNSQDTYNGDRLSGVNSSTETNAYHLQVMKRNRRSGFVVPDKIHQRMIKNRESAARSRARKQAYDAQQRLEIMQLKEENEQLRRMVRLLSATGKEGEKNLALKRSFSGPF